MCILHVKQRVTNTGYRPFVISSDSRSFVHRISPYIKIGDIFDFSNEEHGMRQL